LINFFKSINALHLKFESSRKCKNAASNRHLSFSLHFQNFFELPQFVGSNKLIVGILNYEVQIDNYVETDYADANVSHLVLATVFSHNWAEAND